MVHKTLEIAIMAAVDMENDPDAFFQLLGRCGFNNATCVFLVEQGCDTARSFMTSIPLDTIDTFATHCARARPTQAAANVRLPFTALRHLKAFRMWVEYRRLRGQSYNPAGFTDVVALTWVNHIGVIAQALATSKAEPPKAPPVFTSFSTWPQWEEFFLTHVSQKRGAALMTPISYIVRPDADVTVALLIKDDYESIDEDLYNTIILEGQDFRADNKMLFDILKPLLVDGPGWPSIQVHNRTHNGRAAFLALKAQAEGQSAVTTRKAKAYAELATANYSGKARYSLDQYIARHQRAHIELESLGEPVAATKKVADFLKGITDPKLDTGKSIVDGDNAKLNDFELCQQYFKTLVENSKIRNTASGGIPRQVSAVTAGRPNKPANHGHGRKPVATPRPGGAVHAGSYSDKEYRALSDEDRTKVKALRAAAKLAKKRKASAVSTDDDRQVSSVASGTIPDPVPATPLAPSPVAAVVQFGKSVYKKTKTHNTPTGDNKSD